MFTMTITLKHTEHQIVLAFDTMDSLLKVRSSTKDAKELVLADDYGQAVQIPRDNIAGVEMTDVENHWKYRNKLSIIKLRAENDFNLALQSDPTLMFLVGGAGPSFGRK